MGLHGCCVAADSIFQDVVLNVCLVDVLSGVHENLFMLGLACMCVCAVSSPEANCYDVDRIYRETLAGRQHRSNIGILP